MSRKFLTTEEAFDYLMSLADESDDSDPEMIILSPDPDIVTDDEEIDEACTSIEHGHAIFDEKLQEETAGSIEILKKKNDAEFISTPKWTNRTPKFSSAPESFYNEHHKKITDMISGKSPLELFEMMAENMIAQAVEESNKYAGQKNNHDFCLKIDEFKQFLGVIFYSRYHILPREKMYWENAPDIGTTLVSQAMSRKRYFDIKKYLHFNDNTAIDSNRYYKVRPNYIFLNEALQQFGVFAEHLSIDERMVRYFGRHGCKMNMKGKPVKFGYKLWILSSFDGYPFYIIPYQGAQKENGSGNSSERLDKDMKSKKEKKTLSQTVVENLLSVVETPAKHKIYMDNFFTSYDLLVSLRDKRFFATGTVRENRMAKCPLKSSKILGKMDRGTSDRKFDTKNEIAAVRWNDNRVVSLINNFEDTRCFTKVERRMKGGKQKVDVPSCVVSYNKYKNCVDLFDNHMETYFSSIQGKKWHWPLFVNAFETSLVAAWKISKFFAPEQALDLLEFRRHITIAYLGLCVPRNIADRNLGIQQKQPRLLETAK
ncbi:PiggyBac transposable element-derived protein 3 [Araneus ventricosus]|uniref:PiggyBac transposable element-derived protein 3 n=1 Tax=Araneus ventricosus TaxID=182803 RepID=A0A4Y2S2R0_ARAVE|nr:PiggyBac transposable element-derived protein 3 [Araneus ventricosus]